MVVASKKIKQQQLLAFFVDLIDSKKYNLFFLGRHYQNIHVDLASISRIDTFVQITPPDFKKRKTAFNVIIKQIYNTGKKDEFGFVDTGKKERTEEQLSKICMNLAAKTEHYKLTNLIQVAKTLYKIIQ